MNQPKLKVEVVGIDRLAPYENNAKIHTDKQVAEIAASIEQFGFSDPIGVWTRPDGALEIVEGHGRLLAARRLGIDRVPIVRLDHLDDEGRRAYTHIHNQTTLSSGFDWDKLSADMAALPEIDWAAFGFEQNDPDALPFDETAITEDEPDARPPARSRRGDIWQLGQHRVMCGDSTSPEDLAALFDGARPVMVFTDPPYGVAIGDKNKDLDTFSKAGRITDNIMGDTMDTADLRAMLTRAFRNLREQAAPDCSYYISSAQGGELCSMMYGMLADAGLPVRHNLIWVKNVASFSMGRLDYEYRHEPIFYTWTGAHSFYGGYSTSVIDETKPIDKMSKAELKEALRAYQDARDTSVIYADKPLRNDLHPTMKPVKLCARFIHNSSREGDPIADIFGGSGSTLIAAEQLKRRAYLMELDPHYCDVIVKRWELFTGQSAVLAKAGE